MKRAASFSEVKLRFWSGVDVRGTDECWPWLRSTVGNGYGVICFRLKAKGKKYRVMSHRFAMMLHLGHSLPSSTCVLHKCDNPVCCNPNHLFVGSRKDNTQDCIKKNRFNRPKGSSHYRAKLKEADVIQIRKMHNQGASIHEIRRRYKIAGTTCLNIIKRVLWKHI